MPAPYAISWQENHPPADSRPELKRGLLALVFHMKMGQVVLLRIHEQHPDNNAVEHTDGGHKASSELSDLIVV